MSKFFLSFEEAHRTATTPPHTRLPCAADTSHEMPQIQYSEKYYDDIYEYRYQHTAAFTRRDPREKKKRVFKVCRRSAEGFSPPVVPIYGRLASGMTVWHAAFTIVGTLARCLRRKYRRSTPERRGDAVSSQGPREKFSHLWNCDPSTCLN